MAFLPHQLHPDREKQVMNNKMSFGKYEGRTYEWLFFNAPWYADWIYLNNIHQQPHNFDEDEGRRFGELYRRASHLAGTCLHCHQRPISRLGFSTDSKTCMFAGWDCIVKPVNPLAG